MEKSIKNKNKIDNFAERIIIEPQQLWYVNIDGSKSAIGKCAVFSNKGIILENGGLLKNGEYIRSNNNLPPVESKKGFIKIFKKLFLSIGEDLRKFEERFCEAMSQEKHFESWNNINCKLESTEAGRELVSKHGFKIRAIVDLNTLKSKGISINDSKKTMLGKTGKVYYVKSSKRLVLVANGQNIRL